MQRTAWNKSMDTPEQASYLVKTNEFNSHWLLVVLYLLSRAVQLGDLIGLSLAVT